MRGVGMCIVAARQFANLLFIVFVCVSFPIFFSSFNFNNFSLHSVRSREAEKKILVFRAINIEQYPVQVVCIVYCYRYIVGDCQF